MLMLMKESGESFFIDNEMYVYVPRILG